MSKKQKLIIPPKLLRWVRPELKERNGEISDMWDEGLPDEWLIDIPDSLSIGNKGGTFSRKDFTIISDVELPDYNIIHVRLYWTGDCWSEDVESSEDYPDLETAKNIALSVKVKFLNVQISILRITSSTETEEIAVN